MHRTPVGVGALRGLSRVSSPGAGCPAGMGHSPRSAPVQVFGARYTRSGVSPVDRIPVPPNFAGGMGLSPYTYSCHPDRQHRPGEPVLARTKGARLFVTKRSESSGETQISW
ncbi:hypothetical protein GCM10010470_51010 [Saccharopolyspora taberi]|uniref:Uncharacterized protein n=1 Tax=Saccharopolyspora taberi TaxID=60895 RepID=A0ABN3VJ17_9PSEU